MNDKLMTKAFQVDVRRGRVFELQERAEWHFIPSTQRWYEFTVPFLDSPHTKGRIDVLMREHDGSFTLIEAKATDWDRMGNHRIRPNVYRHARQVWSYVLTFWDRGIDVCPALVYSHAPSDFNRRITIENILEGRWVQVVWADERENEIIDTA